MAIHMKKIWFADNRIDLKKPFNSSFFETSHVENFRGSTVIVVGANAQGQKVHSIQSGDIVYIFVAGILDNQNLEVIIGRGIVDVVLDSSDSNNPRAVPIIVFKKGSFVYVDGSMQEGLDLSELLGKHGFRANVPLESPYFSITDIEMNLIEQQLFAKQNFVVV